MATYSKDLLKKWKESKLFDDLKNYTTESISSLYECEAKQFIMEESNSKLPDFEKFFEKIKPPEKEDEPLVLDYNEVNGDLIKLAKKGKFDVITHGCNCQSIMSAGIAVPMNLHFDVSTFPMELQGKSIEKLGNIDYKGFTFNGSDWRKSNPNDYYTDDVSFYVVNSYTQNYPSVKMKPLDYEALTLCMRKINSVFRGKHIGLPQIGAGLAGGDWNRIKEIIKTELKDCKITVVIYDNK